MKKVSLVPLVLLLVSLTLAACSSPAATTTSQPTTPKVTTTAATTSAPSNTAVNASAIYVTNCSPCHGANREGNTAIKAPALNASTLAGKSASTIADTITNGKSGTTMMGFGKQLSAPQIDALVTFITQP